MNLQSLLLVMETVTPTPIAKAYPTEHAARQAAPGSFKSIRSKELAPGVRALVGFGADPKAPSKIQSIRFDASKFTAEQAKAWLVAHDFNAGAFEEASGDVAELGPSVADVHIPTAMSDELSDEEEDKLKESLMDLLITKSSAEQRIAYAVVYKPDIVDSQNDFASAAEIEKMAHAWMRSARAYDFQHMVDVPAGHASVVESYLAPCDLDLGSKTITKGSWIVATYFDDPELWNLVKAGHIRAYSIFGKGKRIPVT